MTTRQHTQTWLDAYVVAWRSPSLEQLAAIFTDDIAYYPSPWKQPVKGLQALGVFWEKARTGPDEAFEITYDIVAVEGTTAVARITVTYAYDTPKHWRDLWIIKFAKDGLCYHFEEWPFSPDQPDGH